MVALRSPVDCSDFESGDLYLPGLSLVRQKSIFTGTCASVVNPCAADRRSQQIV